MRVYDDLAWRIGFRLFRTNEAIFQLSFLFFAIRTICYVWPGALPGTFFEMKTVGTFSFAVDTIVANKENITDCIVRMGKDAISPWAELANSNWFLCKDQLDHNSQDAEIFWKSYGILFVFHNQRWIVDRIFQFVSDSYWKLSHLNTTLPRQSRSYTRNICHTECYQEKSHSRLGI